MFQSNTERNMQLSSLPDTQPLASMPWSSFNQSFLVISANKSCDENQCPICPLAKQSRMPFSLRTISSVFCFNLIHVDIWDGYHEPSLTGAKYFLTIVDDHTRNTWVYLMKHKSETRKLLINFIHLVETQFDKKVSCA